MSKNVFFIDDEFEDFEEFSKILTDNGFYIYPNIKTEIDNQEDLSNFLHNQTGNYQQLKNNVFNYIVEKELYDKIQYVLLDINLLSTNADTEDESGTTLLAEFRNDFYSFFKEKKNENPIYEHWSDAIPVIILTDYEQKKCTKFKQQYGYPTDALNKEDVRSDSNMLIAALNTAEAYQHSKEKQVMAKQKKENQSPTYSAGRDMVFGNQEKAQANGTYATATTGRGNIVQSYNEIELVNKLKNSHNVSQNDANKLVEILREEKQNPNNETLISKMKNWWNNVKTYVRDLSVEVLGSLLGTLCLLPLEQITLIIQAIQ
jgi:hypothetical protein